MTRLAPLAAGLILALGCAAEQELIIPAADVATVTGEGAVRFRPLHIELAAEDAPIGAYQVELLVADGDATIVGVEGGDLPGFDAAPFYDPAALAGGRIVLAAFSTAETLPTEGTHRVATVHLREAGPAVTYELELIVAADATGAPVAARPFIGIQQGAKP